MKNNKLHFRSFQLSSLLVLVLAAMTSVLVAGCDDELIDDATFRLWCLDELCSWKLEAGKVRPAPTWHKDDYGVELVETPTVISQDLKKSAECLVFTTVADVAPNAQVTVGIDFTGDGVADYEQPIAAVGFREVTTKVTAPRATSVPRIFISKKGVGKAVLAQIRLRSGDGCSGPPILLRDRPLGDVCSIGLVGECKSGVCCEGVCAECCNAPGASDGGPQYSGVDQYGAVVPSPAVACPGTAACERRDVKQFAFITTVVPLQCDPGRRLRLPGTLCLADDDCASGECEGATASASSQLFFTDDAGACPGADFPDAGGADCLFARVREGRCR